MTAAAQLPATGSEREAAFAPWQLVAIVLLTLLAAGLRLFRLGEWGFWVDEAHTFRDATMPLWDDGGHGAAFTESVRSWYPLPFLLLRGLLASGLLGGDGEGWLRLPFAFAGIVSVPALAFCGRAVVGRPAALLAALLLAVNPWHIYWSQNARGYGLVVLFAILAGGAAGLGLARRGLLPHLLAALAALLAGLCHPSGLLLFPAGLAFLLLGRGSPRDGGRLALRVFGVVLGAVLLALLAQEVPPLSQFRLAKPDTSLLHLLLTSGFYFRAALLLAAVVGLWLLWRRRRQGALLLGCWAIVPMFLLAVIGATISKVTARYGVCVLPAVLLLAAAALRWLWHAAFAGGGGWPLRLLAVLAPLGLLADSIQYDIAYYTVQHGDRAQWRQAVAAVTRASGGRLLVFTVNEPTLNYYLRRDYYEAGQDRGADPDRLVVPILKWNLQPDPPDVADPAASAGEAYLRRAMAQAAGEDRELFFVVSLPELQEIDEDGSLLAALRARGELLAELPVWVGPKDESLYVYRLSRPR